MSNPTSNFGWQMPTNTDLVSQLPADFEVFGQAVDTSLADLKGGTTGQVLKKNSNTDMDFVWSADAAGMTNPMTTTGDTIYSSSGSTPARLGIGTAGQVLQVNSGATAPEWATFSSGSMTQLATGTLSGTSTQISSITGTYKDLRLVVYGYYSSAIEQMQIRVNGDSGTNYVQTANQTSGASVGATSRMLLSQDIANGVGNAIAIIDLYDYAATNHWKSGNALFVSKYDTGTAYANVNSRGAWLNASAITSIEINTVNGNSWSAGTYILYGVK